MSSFTCTLPDELLRKLNAMAVKFSIPRDKFIEEALQIYLDQRTRAEYEQSFEKASVDVDIIKMAEEGMDDIGY